MPPLQQQSDDTGDRAAAPPQPPALRLTTEQRERISAELARQQVGDPIARRLFLAALDYQVAALPTRLAGRPATAAALAAACAEAAEALAPPSAAAAQRVCLTFVSELARAFDDCFETAPTPEPEGPFMRVLALLREMPALPLTLDLERAAPLVQAPRP